MKDAVFEVLRDAKAAAGLIVAIRTLFYKVRPLVQKYTDKTLDYDYFSQTLVPEYSSATIEALEGLYYEARGELHHPHDGTVTQLGTREVRDYTLPQWQFDKVLYIEKTGLQAQLAPYQLGQKYDMAHHLREGLSGGRVPGSAGAPRVPRHDDLRPARRRHSTGTTSPAPSARRPPACPTTTSRSSTWA